MSICVYSVIAIAAVIASKVVASVFVFLKFRKAINKPKPNKQNYIEIDRLLYNRVRMC